MTDWSKCSAVESDPEKMRGAWVFVGTRVSITSLFNHLKVGVTVHEFVEWFPGVEPSQVEEVLQYEIESLNQQVKV